MVKQVAIDEGNSAQCFRPGRIHGTISSLGHRKGAPRFDFRWRVLFKYAVYGVPLYRLATCILDEASKACVVVKRCGGTCQMHDGLFLDSSIDIVSTVLKSQFSKMVTDIHTVGLDVWNVVEHQPRYGDGA